MTQEQREAVEAIEKVVQKMDAIGGRLDNTIEALELLTKTIQTLSEVIKLQATGQVRPRTRGY